MAKRTKMIICGCCGLSKPHDARGLCHTCYTREKRAGRVDSPPQPWDFPVDEPTEPPTFGSRRLPLRFWEKVQVTATGCWAWTASKEKGYGQFSVGSTSLPAYVVAYRALVGPVANGLELDHTCHSSDPTCLQVPCAHRACCNPNHLEPVTHQENMTGGVWAKKTHCPQGHEYSGFNLIVNKGRRHCRTCIYARTRAAKKSARDAAKRISQE